MNAPVSSPRGSSSQGSSSQGSSSQESPSFLPPPSVAVAALVAALVGFGSTLAVVLAAATAVGASPDQASSWVAAMCLGVAATSLYLCLTHRLPIITSWSTPGAALIAGFGTGVGMEAATGAFLFAAVLMLLCAAIKPLGNLVARIPIPVAAAMLAGVLARFAIAVAENAPAHPGLVLSLVALFFVIRTFSPSAAVLAVLVAGTLGIFAFGLASPMTGAFEISRLVFNTPTFEPSVLLGLGVPLFIVSMAAQNLPGFAVLRASGYVPPTQSILGTTGIASLLTAPFGCHGVTLAAITAAICTGPDAHPNPAKRYLCGPVYALCYLILAGLGASLVVVFAALPPAFIATVAGLSLLSPLAGATATAMIDEKGRIAAMATFATTASGISALGLAAPVWGLVVGLLILGLERVKSRFSGRLPR